MRPRLGKLLRPRNLALVGGLVLLMVTTFYLVDYSSREQSAVLLPIQRGNIFLREGEVDIAIERVDQLHVYERDSSKIDSAKLLYQDVPTSKSRNKTVKQSVKVEGGREEVVEGADVAVPVVKEESGSDREGASFEEGENPEADARDSNDLFDSSMEGYLNYDVWHWVVGYLVDDLRVNRDFPLYPNERTKLSRLHTEFDEADPADVRGRYGHKIYGFLLPPVPGTYRFKVELTQMTAAASVELWVSTDSDPLNINKVLEHTYDDMVRTHLSRPVKRVPTSKSAQSSEVSLESCPCYFEFLEKAYEGKVITDLSWMVPGSNKFEAIPSTSFAMALRTGGNVSSIDGPVAHFLRGPLASNQLQSHHLALSVSNTIYPITELNVLPTCEFTSMSAKPHRIKPYRGVYEVRESKVAPKDDTWFMNWRKKDKGNVLIPQATVDLVTSLYGKALNASKEVQGDLIGLRLMEETANRNDGNRYMLEMDVQLHKPMEAIVHTSEYVYLKEGSTNLCHTSNFQWTKNAEVHFVVSVKNLGLWVTHLIYNMEDIYEQTGDDHFSLIIVDYQSEDMNIEHEAKKSSFKRITVMHLTGGFSRSGGLQAGIDSVKDKNSIVMTIDMHLTLPIGIVEYVRRHTVQYKMGVAPMFFRLNKGYTEINYNGFWETLTYGLFAMYKSDWLTFKGFNTRKFKTKWGGEDWDIVDRSLSKGFELFRIRPAGLVHYHHTKKGMWGNSEVKIAKNWTLH